MDSAGDAYVTGLTYTAGLATPGAYQTAYTTGGSGFVAAVNSTGTGLGYFTYLGGAGTNGKRYRGQRNCGRQCRRHLCDGLHEYVRLGYAGAYQTALGGIFVTKLSASGSGLIYFTYLGGSNDWSNGIALDASGNTYVTGLTYTSGLATAGAYQTTYYWADAFLAEFNPMASSLGYLSYLGGNDWDVGYGVAIDGNGNAYVTGSTDSPGLATPGAYQATYHGYDAFVARFSGFSAPAAASKMVFTTAAQTFTAGLPSARSQYNLRMPPATRWWRAARGRRST